jgi:glycerol-3-phosphate dehydrogenase
MIKSHRDANGLFSIVGGKLTTHRALAEDCMQRLRRRLDVARRSPTADRMLPGALAGSDRDRLIADLEQSFGPTTATRLWHTYGGASIRLQTAVVEDSELGTRLGHDCDFLVAELVHAIEREHALTLEDILQRRTMAGLQPDFGRRSAPLAADWLVRLGFWDKARAAEELTAYRRFARRFAVPSV